MIKDEVLKKLGLVLYPNLKRDIVSLGLVDDVEIFENNITVSLSLTNEAVFEAIEEQIVGVLSDKEVKVRFLAKKPSSINYGNTKKPNNRAPYAKYIVAITSGKGGVGKTTLSVNLSVALAQKGYKVGLLDADIYGPNIPRMLGVNDEKMTWNENNKIVPSENYGIKLMSVGLTTPKSDTPLVWRSSVAVSALIQFLEDVEWGELDFLIIDMPPGTGDIQLTMAQELPLSSSVIVTTPQTISTDDVSRAVMMFKDIGVAIGGIVENMSYFIAPDTKIKYDIFGSGGGEMVATRYKIPFLGKIPLTTNIREACDAGKPAVASQDHQERKYYQDIADNLLVHMGIL